MKGVNMSGYIIKHNELTAEQFLYLWESVWGEGPSPEQTRLAMDIHCFVFRCLTVTG